MLLQSSKTANPLGEIFICACLLPRGGRSGLDAPPLLRGIPRTDASLFARAKDRSLSHRAADFPNCIATKRPRPPCTENGSHIVGAQHAGDDRDKKKSAPMRTRGAAEKPLTASTATRSNSQSNTNVEPFSTASGATVQSRNGVTLRAKRGAELGV